MEAADPTPVIDRFRAMGSDVVIVCDGHAGLSALARRRIHELERLWSRFLPDSDVSTLNRTDTWVTVSADTIVLFEHAAQAWTATAGAFDPTVLPSLVSAGYADSRSENQGRTDLGTVAVRARAPGMAGIEIDPSLTRIRMPDRVAFDPGGIGKGLAADLVARELTDSGARAVMVSIGGDVRVAGNTPPHWTVEVESPFDPDHTIAELSVRDGAVCTSTVRAKTWTHEGEPMHHIIDPATGDPLVSSIISATVVAAEAWMAEALCKAAIVGEPIDAVSFCEAQGVEAILVDVEGIVWRTRGIERFTP